ncbi:MAG TPA: hypothetical protein VNI61_07810 [Gemmatimonadales bacterium]|nr:hypothetical protein [Gemmatimonadales bacterium]
MMHCTMDDLLALRAGEASVWARRHIEECAPCRAELDAVYQRAAALKALPALSPARDRWPEVRDSLRTARRSRHRAWSLVGLAAAAALAAIVVFRPGASGLAYAEQIEHLKRRSATLESELARLPPEGRVMSGREAALAALLEDRIAVIDGELVRLGLSEAPATESQVLDLWRERVDLMGQLYTVRLTRAAYMGL